MRTTLVFVYGSLKRGFRHHGELEGAGFRGRVRTAGGYRLVLVGEYPALVAAGEETVEGELYEVLPEQLERLDAFEGCPEMYQREAIRLEDGSRAQAYVMAEAAVVGRQVLSGWDRD
jgi:gamma-glutamylaminecyclotransferase